MTIGVGVLGYGYWGPNLVRNFTETPGVRVVACCEPDAIRRGRAKARYPHVEMVDDAAALLARADVDAVVIATPPATHYAIARAALESGRHVFVEKPLATASADAAALAELAAQRRLTLLVDHTFVYTPAVRKIRELLTAGELGQLYYVDSVRVNLGIFQSDVNVLWDLAVHDAAILEYLVDERPLAVSATGAAVGLGSLESIAYVTVRFASGLIAHFHNNWLAPVKVRTILIGGSRKLIMYDDMEPSEKVKVYDRGVEPAGDDAVHRARINYRLGDMWAPRLDVGEALAAASADFVRAIETGETPCASGRSGVNVVRLVEAANRSLAGGGREVAL